MSKGYYTGKVPEWPNGLYRQLQVKEDPTYIMVQNGVAYRRQRESREWVRDYRNTYWHYEHVCDYADPELLFLEDDAARDRISYMTNE